jgi:hypothetical protein
VHVPPGVEGAVVVEVARCRGRLRTRSAARCKPAQ